MHQNNFSKTFPSGDLLLFLIYFSFTVQLTTLQREIKEAHYTNSLLTKKAKHISYFHFLKLLVCNSFSCSFL